MYQDHLGFLWIGTYEGLNRYDGFTFETYSSNPRDPKALSKDYVTGIVEDSSRVLWVATIGGLHRFNRDEKNFTRFERPSYSVGFNDANRLIGLVRDSDDRLWLASESAGIDRFDPRTGSFTPFFHDPADTTTISSDRIHAIRFGHDGLIWIATDAGIDRIEPVSGRVERWSASHVFRMRDRLSRVEDILDEGDGTLWATCANEGLWRWRNETGWKEFVPDWITPADRGRLFLSRLCIDAHGTLWIGSYYDGLLRFEPSTERFRKYIHDPEDRESLVAQTVTTLFLDRTSNLWIGTDQGINVVDTKPAKFHHHTFRFEDGDEKRNNNIMSIIEDAEGLLWLGLEGRTGDRGLVRYELSTGRATLVSLRTATGRKNLSTIYSMARDRNGDLWLGTFGEGLYRLSPPTLAVRAFAPPGGWGGRSMNRMRSVTVARDGSIWLAPRGTPLWMLDPERGRYRSFAGYEGEPLALGALGITSLFEQSSGAVWIGTQGRGALRFDRTAGRYEGYPFDGLDSSSLSYDVVTTFQEDRKGRLWIGTTEGLNAFKPETQTFLHFAEPEGFPGAVICGILEDDDGDLWISTNRGIVRFDPDSGGGSIVRAYDVSDGLQSLEFNRDVALRTSKGEMVFGGNNGLTSFFPRNVQDNSHVPSVVLTSFRVLNQVISLPRAVEWADTIVVEYSQNVLRFEFAALEFTNPKDNLYSYRLEGFDAGWSPGSLTRSVTYTNLDPDTYVLRLRASNNDGIWNEIDRRVTIVVLPPFWMRWWFRSTIAGAILACVILVVRWRESQISSRQEAQERFAKELLLSQEGERKRIAAELHDSLGQNITLMKNASLLAMQKRATKKSITSLLKNISQTASQTLDEARRIAYNLRPYQLDRFGLSEALREMVEEVSRTSPIRWTASIADVDGTIPKESEINVYRIVQEGLNNVLKHSRARHANVRVELGGGGMTIVIDDDGVGIVNGGMTTRRSGTGGFGLSGIRERVRLLGGVCVVISRPHGGTNITITIPEKVNHG